MIISLRVIPKDSMILNTIGFRSKSCIGFHLIENSYNSVNNFVTPVNGSMINAEFLIFYIFKSFFLNISGD